MKPEVNDVKTTELYQKFNDFVSLSLRHRCGFNKPTAANAVVILMACSA